MPEGIGHQKKIIHLDMDCFYAAVEVRDDPSLREYPVIVGGDPGSRGVVSTCCYQARRFGVHSAMASSRAYRLCPQAVFIKPNFDKYRAVSNQIREIFHEYTDLVEPLSLDEAYLDVTGHELYATQIAKRLRKDIWDATNLTASAGVSSNKLLAKIASDFRKPNGLTVVLPEQAEAFMGALSLRKIPGIGPATQKRLENFGWYQCQDVWPCSLEQLSSKLGDRMGRWLYERSRGRDDRPVQVKRVRKSMGAEDTFSVDILDLSRLQIELRRICESVAKRLENRHLCGRTITLKVKYANFVQITRSKTVDLPFSQGELLFKHCCELLRKTDAGQKAVRLLGVSLASLEASSQKTLTEPEAFENL